MIDTNKRDQDPRSLKARGNAEMVVETFYIDIQLSWLERLADTEEVNGSSPLLSTKTLIWKIKAKDLIKLNLAKK